MKTSELTGALLDYWVARADGAKSNIEDLKPGGAWCGIDVRSANVAPPDVNADPSETRCAIAMVPNAMREFPACILGQKIGRGKIPYRSSWFYPSTVWDHGGPIIERERISTWRYDDIPGEPTDVWFAAIGGVHGWDDGGVCGNNEQRGNTALIAAMRAYVASKFGDEVPDEVRP